MEDPVWLFSIPFISCSQTSAPDSAYYRSSAIINFEGLAKLDVDPYRTMVVWLYFFWGKDSVEMERLKREAKKYKLKKSGPVKRSGEEYKVMLYERAGYRKEEYINRLFFIDSVAAVYGLRRPVLNGFVNPNRSFTGVTQSKEGP